jgi:glycosyltransferase involved in cell wall biosynthesis
MNWICSQIGAREHYAIPRVLHRSGKLDSLYTDLWASPLWREAGAMLGRPVLDSRYHPDLETARVKNFNLTTLVDKAFGGGSDTNPYDWFLRVGSDFGSSVEASLQRRKGVNWSEKIFFGYDTGFLEAASWVRGRGGKSVVCQMDPSRFEVDLVKAEEKLWHGWARRSAEVPDDYFKRREEEWAIADLVIVNSEWSRQALIQQGVSESKLMVVPLAYEASEVKSFRGQKNSFRPSTFDSRHTLRVLFLGQVILRKGIQYLIEAARSFKDEPVHFDVVGPIGISEEAIRSAPDNMTFHGAISRDKAPEFFAKSDLFVLPTLSDGFALTQIEALAYGLTVITTPNCGEVVSDGVDGLIVQARDASKLADALKSFVESPERLSPMSDAARLKAAQFGLQQLTENLEKLEERLK